MQTEIISTHTRTDDADAAPRTARLPTSPVRLGGPAWPAPGRIRASLRTSGPVATGAAGS